MSTTTLPSVTSVTAFAPRPTNEIERLSALHNLCILDTAPEPSFDTITELGASIFSAPIALISLVDEHRQFFKSHFGTSLTQVPRDNSFTTYAILGQEPLIVLDTITDTRFASNPFVLDGPRVRFYAGAPLISSTGAILGSFCVLDTTPRSHFSQDNIATLQRLAALVVNTIEQRVQPARVASVERDVLTANERYRLATQATTEGIWDWDCATGQMFMSARLRAIIGQEPVDSHVHMDEWIARVHPNDRPSVFSTVNTMLTTDLPNSCNEYRVQHQDGSWRWVSSRAVSLRDDRGRLTRVVGSLADITSTKCIDTLTGLHTRVSISEIIEHRIANGPTLFNLHRPFTLLVVDLDLFKRVNVSLGRQGGDAMLIECARRIAETLTPGSSDTLARISGDEFAILLDSITSEEDAIMYAELLQVLLHAPMHIHERHITMTATIGIVRCTGKISAEALIQQAEAAAHEGKLAGGARNVVFFQQMQDRVLRRMSLATDLREAIDANALELHYQPKFDLQNEQIIGFEALARWRHPVHGFVPPDEFVSIAEESDLILDLGRWTLREAIGQLAEWRASGLISLTTSMAVNLSARQFSDGGLIDNISRKLHAHGIPPSCLSLEVTEGILILDTEAALKTLVKLKALGVVLDLDDFGTGYSSLSYLQRFPFDALKIDRSFVSHLDQEPDRSILVRSIIALGHSLNLKVVAEGIETPQQLAMLKTMGCSSGQGYYFSKPLPAFSIEALVTEKKPAKVESHVPVDLMNLTSTRPN